MENIYTISEVARLLGVSTRTIYAFLKNGDMKYRRLGLGRIGIPGSEVDQYLSSSADLFDKKAVERVVAEKKKKRQPGQPVPLILPTPRPGKSLEEMAGEPFLYTLRLWMKERVILPRLFDWFV